MEDPARHHRIAGLARNPPLAAKEKNSPGSAEAPPGNRRSQSTCIPSWFNEVVRPCLALPSLLARKRLSASTAIRHGQVSQFMPVPDGPHHDRVRTSALLADLLVRPPLSVQLHHAIGDLLVEGTIFTFLNLPATLGEIGRWKISLGLMLLDQRRDSIPIYL